MMVGAVTSLPTRVTRPSIKLTAHRPRIRTPEYGEATMRHTSLRPTRSLVTSLTLKSFALLRGVHSYRRLSHCPTLPLASLAAALVLDLSCAPVHSDAGWATPIARSLAEPHQSLPCPSPALLGHQSGLPMPHDLPSHTFAASARALVSSLLAETLPLCFYSQKDS